LHAMRMASFWASCVSPGTCWGESESCSNFRLQPWALTSYCCTSPKISLITQLLQIQGATGGRCVPRRTRESLTCCQTCVRHPASSCKRSWRAATSCSRYVCYKYKSINE
jgi:hypothetical protein